MFLGTRKQAFIAFEELMDLLDEEGAQPPTPLVQSKNPKLAKKRQKIEVKFEANGLEFIQDKEDKDKASDGNNAFVIDGLRYVLFVSLFKTP